MLIGKKCFLRNLNEYTFYKCSFYWKFSILLPCGYVMWMCFVSLIYLNNVVTDISFLSVTIITRIWLKKRLSSEFGLKRKTYKAYIIYLYYHDSYLYAWSNQTGYPFIKGTVQIRRTIAEKPQNYSNIYCLFWYIHMCID